MLFRHQLLIAIGCGSALGACTATDPAAPGGTEDSDSPLARSVIPDPASGTTTAILNGQSMIRLGRARFSATGVVHPPVGPSDHPPEAMSRDELARAFHAVSVDSQGDVYQAAQPDWSLADKITLLRANEAQLIAEKRSAEALNPPPIFPGTVLGTDDRVRTTDPEASYYRRAAFFGFGGTGTCTGWMIGPRTGITAAHCVWDRATGTWLHGGTVWNPGNDANNAGPWSQVWNNGNYFPTIAQAYIDVGGVEWDLAIINFNNDVGSRTGWFGIDAAPAIASNWFANIGYPSTPPNGGPWGAQYHSFQLENGSGNAIVLNTSIIRFSLDVTGGHSGGPVIQYTGDRSIGVVTNNGIGTDFNWGCRTTTSWVSAIDAWSDWTAVAWWGGNPART